MRVSRYAIAPAVAATLTLGACGGGEKSYDESGQVVVKQSGDECDISRSRGRTDVDCATEYEIILDSDDGEVDVSRAHYEACEIGDHFPRCTQEGQ